MPAQPYHWLSPLEAAAEAGVSLSTITNWRRAKKLKWFHPAGSRMVRIRSDDLEACIQGRPPPSDGDDDVDGDDLDAPLTYEDLLHPARRFRMIRTEPIRDVDVVPVVREYGADIEQVEFENYMHRKREERAGGD